MLNEQVESVMAIAFELARIREEHGAQSGMYLSEVRALRAEVERLAAQAAPTEEMSPEFTDTARAALLWVLWHHQGGSSKVGQPIRFALGMCQHQPLSEYQVREAQRWEAMAPTRDAANVPPGEWNSEPEGLTPKQAWWAGYRVGKGLPPDMPRSEAVAALKAERDAALARVAELEKDAARYQKLLDLWNGRDMRELFGIEDFAALDAAPQPQQEQSK